MDTKKISVVIPCYNEEENVEAIYKAVKKELVNKCAVYDYEILFIDNKSKDRTRVLIERICESDKHVKAIFNAKNFGQFNSPYYGMLQATGDCVILLAADFQDPVEMIPQFIAEWEKGYKIVCGIKTSSKENGVVYLLRSLYYKAIKKMSSVEQIEHFTGFGLYDSEFIQVLRELKDPTPFLRGIVAELGFERKEIPYSQPRRRAGKTHNNWYSLYDAAMLSFTSYTKVGLRIATFFGFLASGISFIIALVYLIMKLVFWERFIAGAAPMVILTCFLGGIQLFFIGLVGEYIMNMNARIMNRPLVIEEKRLNFENDR
ncbi:glycosyltransferase family 2 protein [Wansuia hejianensis]|uniref:Glycosyltransferase family 2 protein n=1 Tax=Wansuia hejianensis TaxID=2763667 RepID=A0A7G9GHF0_9FIRM|nr:glycosyltransferase family 2 protein [Wansuia hejianensis]QNM10232.1 glycosyltransferase family 2 protein [Wansuia hejianensis]